MDLLASNAENLFRCWHIKTTSLPVPDNWSWNGRVNDIEQNKYTVYLNVGIHIRYTIYHTLIPWIQLLLTSTITGQHPPLIPRRLNLPPFAVYKWFVIMFRPPDHRLKLCQETKLCQEICRGKQWNLILRQQIVKTFTRHSPCLYVIVHTDRGILRCYKTCIQPFSISNTWLRHNNILSPCTYSLPFMDVKGNMETPSSLCLYQCVHICGVVNKCTLPEEEIGITP
jgi:hypothetical protein